ncbi:autoinducer binding domain-containing protein [Pseudooceanicola sp. LIPI14-2-Ac024]|uniref:autoinducer binding domain-containing protein n=1 Tax=Pseudooceanicola sp. LIPI14-2-Ac024 TaxID=3344875 RepID=UPI0035CF9944
MFHARTTSANALRSVLAKVDDFAGLQWLIERGRRTYRTDHMVYHWVNAPDGQIACGTYPADWAVRYDTCGYQRIDPVVLACANSFDPVDWKRLDWSRRQLRNFLAEAQAHGLSGQGLSLPIHGPNGEFAILTANHGCSDEEWARFSAANSDQLHLLGHAIHGCARRILDRQPIALTDLSPREADAMQLIASGVDRQNAARRLEISEHTLRDHLASARAKLGARNLHHAVAKAVAKGQIVI